MKRNELRQLLRGLVVATPTPFDEDFDVDLGRMAELTRWWVESGLVEGKAVIKVASVIGEVPQLTEDEWASVVKTTVQATNGKAPVITGIHCKDTKRTIEDARKAHDLGAVGLQVSAPIFNDPNQDDILRYFEAVSDAIEIGIMVYNMPWMAYGGIYPETFQKMADFEHVVAIKWSTPEGYAYDEVRKLSRDFNILENGHNLAQCYKLGGRGFIDYAATAYPAYELRILELLESGQYDEGQALWDTMSKPLNEFYAKITARSGGQARLKKGVMAVMGHPMGAMRLPSLPLTEQEMAELRELLIGLGWPVPEKN